MSNTAAENKAEASSAPSRPSTTPRETQEKNVNTRPNSGHSTRSLTSRNLSQRTAIRAAVTNLVDEAPIESPHREDKRIPRKLSLGQPNFLNRNVFQFQEQKVSSETSSPHLTPRTSRRKEPPPARSESANTLSSSPPKVQFLPPAVNTQQSAEPAQGVTLSRMTPRNESVSPKRRSTSAMLAQNNTFVSPNIVDASKKNKLIRRLPGSSYKKTRKILLEDFNKTTSDPLHILNHLAKPTRPFTTTGERNASAPVRERPQTTPNLHKTSSIQLDEFPAIRRHSVNLSPKKEPAKSFASSPPRKMSTLSATENYQPDSEEDEDDIRIQQELDSISKLLKDEQFQAALHIDKEPQMKSLHKQINKALRFKPFEHQKSKFERIIELPQLGINLRVDEDVKYYDFYMNSQQKQKSKKIRTTMPSANLLNTIQAEPYLEFLYAKQVFY